MSERSYPWGEPQDDDFDSPEDDLSYCECELQPYEDEQASNQCAACGKPLT